MIGRVILAALLAGIAAGLVMGAIQHARLTPLILEAETYETAGHAHDHATPSSTAEQPAAETQPAESHEHDDGWKPADGWQRTFSTTANWALAGAAFAALMAGISLITGLPITRANGVIWGLCGFLAVAVAPAAGLSPELPGMPAADLYARQIWWVGTILATGIGIYLIAVRRELWAVVLAIIVIGLPHIIGAPAAESGETSVPAELAASFVANSIAASAIFWTVLGLFLGLAYDRYAKDIYAT
jgi:cobalt transporter subunit CbtA